MKYTIVTINFNNENGLAKTIESVYNQTCTDYEYIIKDGLSTDKSIEIANSYKKKFKEKGVKYIIVSEKDKGIYNAMNSGIELAQGEYINFMNSGDRFASENILSNLIDIIDSCDILYGDSYAFNSKGKIIDYHFATKLEDFRKGIPFCHQSSFVKTELAKEYKFNEKYKIFADYDMMLRLYLNKKKFVQVKEFLSIFESDGVSSKWNTEDDIVRADNGLPPVKRSKLKWMVRKITPMFIINLRHKLLRKKANG